MKDIDELLAQRLLVEAGILKQVKNPEDGEWIAYLDPEEVAQYDSIVNDVAEIQSLRKLIREYTIKLNMKSLVYNARRTLWMSNVIENHKIARESITQGTHVDRAGMALRRGSILPNVKPAFGTGTDSESK